MFDSHEKLLHAGQNAPYSTTLLDHRCTTDDQTSDSRMHQVLSIELSKYEPLFGRLPLERVSISTPFAYTDIDPAKFLTSKEGQKKKLTIVIVVFCFSTKAVHLELVNSLNMPKIYKEDHSALLMSEKYFLG